MLKNVRNILGTDIENEKRKISQNQERIEKIEERIERIEGRLDRIEGQLTTEYANEKVKIKQNQERLDRIETLLATEYANEKIKIQQNQQRLDNLEQTSNQHKRELDIIFNGLRNGNTEIKRFNFLEKVTNSQSGEDAILAYVVSRLNIPFEKCNYLDLGANRPVEGSNTNFFYTQGARGVLVEANPELIPDLQKYRSEDVILNRCLDIEEGKQIEFIVMTDDGLSTPNEETVAEIQRINPNIKIKSRVAVESITANRIFEDYFSTAPIICSIDIEGKDIDILKSIDFSRHRPLLIISEMIEYSNKIAICDKRRDIMDVMDSVGYVEYAFTGINSIFIDLQALKEKWKY